MNNQNNDSPNPTVITQGSDAIDDGQKKAMSILDLDALIKRYLKDIEKLQEDVKAQKEMFNDSFNNDIKYKESNDKVKEINRVKSAAKQTIMREPSVVTISEKLNSLKDEIKDAQDALSGYVREYQRLSGANEFEDEDGNVRQIVHVVKLVKKSKFRP